MVAEIASLRQAVERLSELVANKDARIAEGEARIAELERLLSESRRSGKRQAAPFSKGDPEEEPAKPGRRSGQAHGRHGHRMVPASVDREVDVPLPSCCPDCGGDVELGRLADQYETDLGEMRPKTTRFRVPVGRCTRCGRRVQGRHAEQASDALGAAGAQIGPNAKAWAAWLHYGLGLSFVKSSKLLARLGVNVSAGALCQSSQSSSTALVPVQAAIVEKLNSSKAIVPD
ncbi:MAG TPA: transposase, partial [Acidimicrobiales bacterium]|nr:transposase [Acidimicrobiales bacterium]